MDPLVMGVDSSTQSTTVQLRSLESGELTASASSPHPPTTPPRSEADPNAWWRALVDCCEQLGDLRSRVVAVSVAGQQHGLIVVDASDRVVRPAKLWNDTESAPQADALRARFGEADWALACGSVPVASFTITKLAWLLENEPESIEDAARIMLPHDWITWRLTGEHVTDRGDASGTGWFDPVANGYRYDLLALAGERNWAPLLPRVLGPLEPAGKLGDDAAAELGLDAGIVVGPGTGDNMAAALGLGLQPGDVAISLGTSGTAFAVSSVPTADESGVVAGFADATGRYLPLVCTLNATRVTDTVASWLGVDLSELSVLALKAPSGSEGVVMVPFFDGERTPNRPEATGEMVGLRTGTTATQIARAAHEGVICGLLNGVDALAGNGSDTSGRMILAGGGARSPAYRQVLADLAGTEVIVPETTDAVATGSCLQAAAVKIDTAPLDLASTWELGAGAVVEPTPNADGKTVRAAFDRAVYGG